ncbi:MAG: threonine synthase [Patescibacteria group bacterium]
MRYHSIQTPDTTVSFGEAVLQGLPPDRSLYVPESIPEIFASINIKGAALHDVAKLVLRPFIDHSEMTDDQLDRIVENASNFPIDIVDVGDKKVLELFHGPTAAFKDVAARYLSGFMAHYTSSGDTCTILTATSGDTGGAMAHGFGNADRTNMVVLYPNGRVSDVQEQQLTHTHANVTTYRVSGSFDDCQDMVKLAFDDPELQELNLTSANSINIGRLLPQIIYYAYAHAQTGETHRIVVPTGNMGNVTACVMAEAMGIPISSVVVANNRNATFHNHVAQNRADFGSMSTYSSAMDVSRPNNLPRLLRAVEKSGLEIDERIGNRDKRKDTPAEKIVATGATTNHDVITAIRNVHEQHGYVLDPHTAVAWHASERDPTDNDLIVSTAAPEKFPGVMERADIVVDTAELIGRVSHLPESVTEIPADYEALKRQLLTT